VSKENKQNQAIKNRQSEASNMNHKQTKKKLMIIITSNAHDLLLPQAPILSVYL